MRSIKLATLLLLIVAATLPGATHAAAGPSECRYLHVVDPCQMDLLIFDAGNPYITHNIPLSGGFAGQFQPGGVDFATVPAYAQKYSFITQGPYLRVIHHQLALPWRTIDVELSLDIPGLRMNRLQAAEPVTIDGTPRYLLYVVGYRTDPAGHPWLLVFDQEVLLADTLDLGAALLASGPLCLEGDDCLGAGSDIAVGAPLASGPLQEAYASVFVTDDGVMRQRYYRITLHENLTFDVTLEPWNDEGVPWGGSAHRALGVDYDSLGLQPFGAFQTTSVISNLATGEASCPVTGDPVDVEVWGPGAGLEHPYYTFATSIVDGASDRLLAFPAGECPDGGADTLSVPVGDFPRALGISSATDGTIWVYTANKNHGISAVRVHIWNEPGAGDRIDVLETLDIPFEGCPISVTFRDESYGECELFDDQPDPASPGPPDISDCPPGSTDPDCIEPEPDTPEPTCDPESGNCSLPLRGR